MTSKALRNTGISAPPAEEEAKSANRRRTHRFAMHLAAKFRRIEPRSSLDRIIVGESLNISSKGLLFTATEAFNVGEVVEAFIDWPMLLDSRIRLTLVVEGVIMRTAKDHMAMRIERYEFKTRSISERAGAFGPMTACAPQRALFQPRMNVLINS
ncbi:MAG TPA: PilZ domain-containing protein [Bryobacteraceae bacterium]